MFTNYRCRICNSTEETSWLENIPDYEYNLPFRTTLLRCGNCQTIQQQPMPTAQDLLQFYPSDYHAYSYSNSMISNWLKAGYSRKVGRELFKLIPADGRVLDVGCANGSFLTALESIANWELHGIDINPKVIEDCRNTKLHLKAGQLEQGVYPDEFFDAIIMTHLIEHVVDPLETLRICLAILKPGGVVVGELPNVDSWDFKLFHRYWGGLHLPRHLFFWSTNTFKDLGKRAGFASVQVFPMIQPAHWAISLQNWLTEHGLPRTWIQHGRMPMYPWIVMFFSAINLAQNMGGKPSIMGFVFRK
jgi:ubiquinone/menaquinone biosynthesis C-methylase UbiE